MSALTFSPSPPALAALALLALVVGVSAVRAMRRLQDGPDWRRLAVAALNAVVWLAMALLLAPPQIERPVGAQVTLLTAGATSVPEGSGAVYAVTDSSASMDSSVRRLATAGQLILRHPDLERLRVVGHGLDEASWRSLPSELDVEASVPPLAGAVQVAWPPVLDAGEPLIVTGELRWPDPAQVAELQLVDPAGVVTASVSARSGQAFALDAVPRAPGALTYRLRVLRGDTVAGDEPVGVFVRPADGARLLVVQSAPSFDSRQLVNWAADRGNPVVVHTRISRARDLSQGFNLPADTPLDRTPALLAATDLAVVDGRRWRDMEGAERERFLAAVRSGMGLLLRVDDTLAMGSGPSDLAATAGVTLAPASATAPDTRFPVWPGMTPARPLAVAPWQLIPLPFPAGARTLTVDEEGRLLETWRPLGAGRIAVSLLRERQRWATSGERSDFARYWSRILGEVGRPAAAPRWRPPAARERRRPGERFAVCARPGAGNPSLAMTLSAMSEAPPVGEDRRLALRPRDWGNGDHCAFGWPAAAGWHRLRLLDASEDGPDASPRVLDELLLRVYDPTEWSAHAAEERQRATLERAARTSARAAPRTVTTPLSPWWPWTLLLLSAGLLWLERRWDDLG